MQYVDSLNMVNARSGIASSVISVASTYQNGNTSSTFPLGTNNYTVIMHAPYLSAFYANGGAGEFSTATKLGGLHIG